MKKFLFVLTAFSSIWGNQPESFGELPALDTEQKNPDFTYLVLGMTGSFFNRPDYHPTVMGVDPFVGRRFFVDHHAWDIGAGAWISGATLVYAQGSYLYYPMVSKGPYLGAGVTMGTFVGGGLTGKGWVNLPLTVGYQFRTQKNFSPFLQVQVSPFTLTELGTATISFGWGF